MGAASDAVERSARGASLLMVLVLGQRIVTFTMNTLITRTVNAEVLGFASSDMELLLATLLFMSRESFRLLAIRITVPEAPAVVRAARRQELLNVAWGPVPLGLTLCGAASVALLWPGLLAGLSSDARLSALFVVAGAALETLAEPVYILATTSLQYGARATAEGAGVLLKCCVTFVLVWAGWGLPAFGFAQLVYGAVLLVVYWRWMLVEGMGGQVAALRGVTSVASLLPGPAPGAKMALPECSGEASSATAPAGEDDNVAGPGSFLSQRSWGLTLAFGVQNVTKHLLTEGNRMVLLTAPIGLRGEFAAVSNYGSLAVRLLLYPIEDAARTLFASLAADAGTEAEAEAEPEAEAEAPPTEAVTPAQRSATGGGVGAAGIRRRRGRAGRLAEGTPGVSEGGSSGEGSEGDLPAAAAEDDARAVARARAALRQLEAEARMRTAAELLVLALRLVLTLGLVLAVLGPPFCGTLVRLLLGARWSGTGVAGGLAAYCLYVLCLALNGVTEAFAVATAPRDAVGWLNAAMAITFGLYVALALGDPFVTGVPGLLALLGIRGLIFADSANMLFRAAAALSVAREVAEKRTGEPLDLSRAAPSYASLGVLVAAGAAARASAWFFTGEPEGGGAATLLGEAQHVGVGAACALAVLASLAVFDGKALRQAYARVRKQQPAETCMHARTTRMAAASGARSLSSLRFDNRALRVLPVDADATNSVRDPVADACFSRVKPTPVDKPRMVAASESALALLGLPLSEAAERADGAEYLSGNKLPDGADPVANCYCGYQFGYFSGQLGDGAAMTLGEVVNDAGERYELQLKGAGKTPYSRTADGRKVLRSSLREFLCSEAMHSLGVPTTRAGSVVTSDSTIVRDVFYTGRPEAEQCSVITRMAPTFLRFGSFEIFKAKDPTTGRAGPSPGNLDLLNRMVDYTCNAFFKDIVDSHAPKGLPLAFPEEDGLPGPKLAGTEAGATTVFEVYKEVLRRTARMVAKWQMVGWCHGVLNTDNMSILGLTLDYGPFAFMDRFDWDFICNTSDDSGRYTYRRQPEMCRWNCKQLGVAWSPAMPGVEWEAALETAFDDEFALAHLEGARAKLGLSADADGASGDAELFESLLDTMAATGADFTRTFRTLMDLGLPAEAAVGDDLSEAEAAAVERVAAALSASLASREDLLTAIRPRIEEERVNMLLQLAPMDSRLRPHIPLLEKEAEAWVSYNRETSLSPEAKAAENKERWSAWLRQFAIRLRGEAKAVAQSDRVESMRLANPKFVLRNYLCQVAIRAAEDGDFSEARRLLARVQDPFDLDKAIPSTIGDAGVELQKSGKVRGGNLVDMSDAPPAEAKSASAAAGAAAKGAGSCNVAAAASDAAMAPAFATSYDGMPPKWACKLRVSCSS